LFDLFAVRSQTLSRGASGAGREEALRRSRVPLGPIKSAPLVPLPDRQAESGDAAQRRPASTRG
jgi:hypothetical protein